MAEADSTLPDGLIVHIFPELGIAKYSGTRAALEAEGILPPDIEWPEGFKHVTWKDKRLSWWLRRHRPDGAKGSRRDFMNVDWWCLHCEPVGCASIQARAIQRKKQELAEAIFRNSPQGIAAINESARLLCAARDDKPFRKFLAQFTDLSPKKRGRKRSVLERAE